MSPMYKRTFRDYLRDDVEGDWSSAYHPIHELIYRWNRLDEKHPDIALLLRVLELFANDKREREDGLEEEAREAEARCEDAEERFHDLVHALSDLLGTHALDYADWPDLVDEIRAKLNDQRDRRTPLWNRVFGEVLRSRRHPHESHSSVLRLCKTRRLFLHYRALAKDRSACG